MKKFLASIDAGLNFTNGLYPSSKRVNDIFVMDSIGDIMSEKQAHQINRCHIFLHCLIVSDIATLDRK